MALYELLIRGKADGSISGSHIIEFDGDRPGLARPVQETDWPSIASEVNAILSSNLATLEAEKSDLETTIADKDDEIKAERQAAKEQRHTLRAEKQALRDELKAEIQELKGERSFIMSQLSNALDAAKEDDADPVQVIRSVKQSIREATKSEVARRREALAAEIAAKNAELAELTP